MITVFPLVFWDFYFDIADTKFVFFAATTLGTILTLLFDLIVTVIKKNEVQYIIPKTGIWILIWSLINFISFIISDYRNIAFIGTKGRNFGLVTVLCIAIMFFVVQFSSLPKKIIINIFIVSSCLVAILGILNSYGIDILGFYREVRLDLRMFYQTTLGHIDICSSFYGITLGISMAMMVFEKRTGYKKYYFFTSALIFCAQYCSGCDSGYINLLVIFVTLYIFIKEVEQFKDLCVLAGIFVTLAKVLLIVNGIFDSSKEMDSLTLLFGNTYFFLCSLIVLILIMLFVNKTGKMHKKMVFFCLVVGIIAVALGVIYFTFIDKKKDIGIITKLLRFNDEWGSRRGYVWRITVENFSSLPIVNMFFGTGPDTMEPVLSAKYAEEMLFRFDAFYDNAHNEYLQYLTVNGILGLISYIGIIVTALYENYKKKMCTDYVELALITGIMCYVIQAVVNINQVITTPFLFLMVAVLCKYDDI